jgi:hypothetical protein
MLPCGVVLPSLSPTGRIPFHGLAPAILPFSDPLLVVLAHVLARLILFQPPLFFD